MLSIESSQNDNFRLFLSLTQSRGLKKEGLFLLSGDRLVREFLAKPNLKMRYELVPPKKEALTSNEAEVVWLTNELFDQIDVLGTHSNILVLEQPPAASLNAIDLKNYTPHGIEVVIPVGAPGNLGALIRSCEAFGVPRVILTQEAANPYLPKAIKASSGSLLRMPLLRGPALKDFPAHCLALDMDGTSIYDFVWPKDALLVVGEEGAGLPGACPFAQRLTIPTIGVESLNAVVAASIALAFQAQKA